MALKKRRILKKTWEEFCKGFTSAHRLRRATIEAGEEPLLGHPGLPFVSLYYDMEEGRISIGLGTGDPQGLVREFASVVGPRAIYLMEEDEALQGIRGLQIQQAPGSPMIRLLFDDEPKELVRGQWIADVAYALYEARGGGHGEDQRDWFQAEALIQEALEA